MQKLSGLAVRISSRVVLFSTISAITVDNPIYYDNADCHDFTNVLSKKKIIKYLPFQDKIIF